MIPNSRIGSKRMSVRTSEISVGFLFFWEYNQLGIQYNQENYTYDGNQSYSIFAPIANIKSSQLFSRVS